MQYLTPITLSCKELTQLGHVTAKQYIAAQASTHTKEHSASSFLGSRTHHFNQRIQASNTADEMKAVISEENRAVTQGASSRFFSLFESRASTAAHSRLVSAWKPAR